ncbi:hypothetical protein LZA78_15675 [Sinirhodobacter sp. WL0062]|uniref:Uncharacterized protein n=1 Tax=Rhodobacter flavimaris TaxID=2907145 RepID=A0ABS8YZ20_9RHOB|nr:hypothetical protein [Sinirhodobacter sp. WL0062]MCE5974923.1 hypothetical protein [Sinirhodobacter sp. WL0062]
MSRTTFPWKIQRKTPDGPLTDAQRRDLSAQFEIPLENLRELSAALGHALDPWLFVPSIITIVKQVERAPTEFEHLMRDLRQAEKYLGKAMERMRTLAVVDTQRAELSKDHFRDQVSTSYEAVRQMNRDFAQMDKTGSAKLDFLGDPDARRTRDDRREAILAAIFRCWYRSGRSETVTTDGSSSERKGPLFDFVDAVVDCVSEPGGRLSGHTIWKDLQQWRHDNRRALASASIVGQKTD